MFSGTKEAFKIGEGIVSETQETTVKEFRLFGCTDGIKLRLIDTQGLSDTSGDHADISHIKNMVEVIKLLQSIDLFLICLDGTNPRFTPYVQNVISLFIQIFPDFLYHSVLVFNKWTTPNIQKVNNFTMEYQDLFSKKFQRKNMPCYFIDSFFFFAILRDNQDGTQSVRELHPNIKERTDNQVMNLISYLIVKNSQCDVRSIVAHITSLSHLNNEIQCVNEAILEANENHQLEINHLASQFQQRVAQLNSNYQNQLANLK
jgi:hypothetical protein